ncbi:MAG TPA: hypothetical protein VHG08_12200 [Longimicrobium sp.]|nr:hypothetical protein [Longimicrobium sp.]
MTSRRLYATVLPLALAGCASAPRAPAEDGLLARMDAAHRGVRVTLSEPAYVAIFEVIPGERVSLLYPAAESDPARIAAGRTTLRLGEPLVRNYAASYYRGWQAPLLYMIASRQPLDDALIRDMRARERTLDGEPFRSNDAGATMELLASLVVPVDQPETGWETDVLLLVDRDRRYARGGAAETPPEPTNRNCPGSSSGYPPTPDERICPRPVRQGGQQQSPPPPLPGNPGGSTPTPRGREN